MSIIVSSPESVGMSSARLARIKPVMQAQIEQNVLSGISTLIARRGKVVHFEQYGYQDREAKLPLQADTIFRMYSMTKPVIATAFMCLYEQGKFDLMEPVSKYIPTFSSLKVLEKATNGAERLVDLTQPVTIYHLLTGTSGLMYDFYEDNPVCEQYRQHRILADTLGVSLETMVAKICALPLGFQPGSQWYYGVNMDVIARLIEIISDKPLDQFLQDTLFGPLNMRDTAFRVPTDKRSRLSAIYGGIDICAKNVAWTQIVAAGMTNRNEPIDVSTTHPEDDSTFLRGGLGLYSTTEDYLRFAQMLLNGGELDSIRVLSPKIIEFMHTNHLPEKMLPIGFETFRLPGYGFGLGSGIVLNVPQTQMPGSVGTYNWWGAAKTGYWIDPKEKLIGVFMAQSMCNFAPVDRIFQTLAYQALVEI